MDRKLINKFIICGIIFVLFVINYGTCIGNNIDDNNKVNNANESPSSSFSTTDWWPMYHHDINLTGYSTSTAPTTNKVLWANDPFDDPMYDGAWYDPQRSSPAIVEDNIYIGVVDPRYSKNTSSSHEFDLQEDSLPLKNPFNRTLNENSPLDRWYEAYLICINAQTGFEKWKTRLDDEYMIKGSPAVADGKVYITTTDNFFGSYGHLFCLDASIGSILWNFTLNGYESFSPTVESGKVYVSGWIEEEDSSRICKLFCLDAETGSEVFNTTLGVGEPVDAISVYNKHVYISILDYSFDTFLYCVDTLNGNISWSKNLAGNFVISSPVIYNGKIFITSGFYDFQANYSCYIDCFDAITGASFWNRTIAGGVNGWSTPAIAYNRIYITISYVSYPYDNPYYEKGWIYCLDINNGDIIWDKLLTQDAVLYSSPAIADGKIYVNSMGYMYIHGYMYCLDAITGNTIWQYWLVFPIYSSPAIANGGLYLASRDYFYAFDDSALYDTPPMATITGSKYGITGIHYNYTLLPEDPEGHDLEVILEFSREWPGSLTFWFTQSGKSEPIGLFPFDEAGEYWLRARVQDVIRYTWSDWTVFTINISEVELRQRFIIGSISKVTKEGDYTFLSAKKMLSICFTPFDFRILTSGEEIVVISNNNSGFIGSRFVFGRFNADIIPK